LHLFVLDILYHFGMVAYWSFLPFYIQYFVFIVQWWINSFLLVISKNSILLLFCLTFIRKNPHVYYHVLYILQRVLIDKNSSQYIIKRHTKERLNLTNWRTLRHVHYIYIFVNVFYFFVFLKFICIIFQIIHIISFISYLKYFYFPLLIES
jgi:hypothetical protein